MIKITADSTCDLPPALLREMNITLVPLYIMVREHGFRDGVDITPTDIFRYFGEEGIVCKTAAANLYDYETLFSSLSKEYDAVIHISLSSELSSSYQNAVLASKEFSNVHIIDSRNLCAGSGQLVYEAASLAHTGRTAKEICSVLEELIPKIDASFVINQLDYLHKGGRCSGVEAIGARIFHIKPCIEVIDGKMQVGKRYRGKFERCIENYVRDRFAKPQEIDASLLFLAHAKCSPQVLDKVRETIQECITFEQIIETEAGCTISNHCGPITLGLLYKRKEEKREIYK